MTIQDFHINFDIELDKTLDFEYPYISTEQKDYWLNKAQDQLVYDCVEPNDPKDKSFEETQDELEKIRTIVIESPNITPTVSGTKYTSILPADYLYRLRHRCTTVDTNCGTKNVGGILAKQLYLNNMLKDPFWKPSAEEPLYYILGNTIKYETLGLFTIVGTQLTYVKNPINMKLGSQYISPSTDVNCELPEYSHSEVLARAISMILENIESQRYQSNLNELNKIE